MGQKFGVLLDEDGPQVSKAFAELFGYGCPAVEGGPEPSGVLLARHNGVEIEYHLAGEGPMGGIYVGRGGGGLPCSVFQEAYYEAAGARTGERSPGWASTLCAQR